MTTMLILSCVLIGVFILSSAAYRELLNTYCPQKYSQLKASGRFTNMPDSWDELWDLWTNPESEFQRRMRSMSGLDYPRVFYGRFVDRHLMPVSNLRLICSMAGLLGLVLMVICGVLALLG